MTDTQALVLYEAEKIGRPTTVAEIIKSLGVTSSKEKEDVRRAVQYHLRRRIIYAPSRKARLVRVFHEGSSGKGLLFKHVKPDIQQ